MTEALADTQYHRVVIVAGTADGAAGETDMGGGGNGGSRPGFARIVHAVRFLTGGKKMALFGRHGNLAGQGSDPYAAESSRGKDSAARKRKKEACFLVVHTTIA